jgi:hypothetical protein
MATLSPAFVPKKTGTIGIGFRRNKMRQVVDLFQDTVALKAIGQLKGKGDNGTSLLAKQYRVVCYCGEKPYDLALSPEFNVSRNPRMEWLLHSSLVGKKIARSFLVAL